MAGSLFNFVYTDGEGSTWVITRDESNIKADNGSSVGYTGSPRIKYLLPKNVKPRYARYTDGTREIQVVVLSPTTVPPTTIYTDFDYIELVGERLRFPSSEDTGLTDGTPAGP